MIRTKSYSTGAHQGNPQEEMVQDYWQGEWDFIDLLRPYKKLMP